MTVSPSSSWGKFSVGLAITSVVFFVLALLLTGFEVLGVESNRAFAIGLTIALVALTGGSAVAGVTGVLKYHERSVLVFIAAIIGLYQMVGAIASLFGLPK